jgi:hypothetical protein
MDTTESRTSVHKKSDAGCTSASTRTSVDLRFLEVRASLALVKASDNRVLCFLQLFW